MSILPLPIRRDGIPLVARRQISASCIGTRSWKSFWASTIESTTKSELKFIHKIMEETIVEYELAVDADPSN